jgi:acyl-CoA synthetase (NDP forming)
MFDRNSIFQAPPKAQFFAGTASLSRVPVLSHSSGKSEAGKTRAASHLGIAL